jgi:purine-binding chemotaxis protein CheW
MTSLRRTTDGEIDWSDLRARVENEFDSSRRALAGRNDQLTDILDARALRLARPIASAETRSGLLEVLPFSLGRERYCLETRYTREVVRLTDYVALPSSPNFLLGLTNLRGEILPIFDLMLFFGFSSKGLMDRSRLVVIGRDRVEFAVITDVVHDVTTISTGDFAPDAVFRGKQGEECVRGLTRDATIVLDGDKLISNETLFIGARPGGGA